jgi:hypothetical protein
MSHVIHDIGIASQIAAYSDAIEVNPACAGYWHLALPGCHSLVIFPMISPAKPNSLGNTSSTCCSMPA